MLTMTILFMIVAGIGIGLGVACWRIQKREPRLAKDYGSLAKKNTGLEKMLNEALTQIGYNRTLEMAVNSDWQGYSRRVRALVREAVQALTVLADEVSVDLVEEARIARSIEDSTLAHMKPNPNRCGRCKCALTDTDDGECLRCLGRLCPFCFEEFGDCGNEGCTR